MPYAFIPMVAAILLGIRYLILGEASRRSKLAVVAVVIASLVIWWYFPEWMAVAILLQVAVSIYVLLYFKLNPYAS
jgi:uncharacterized membrane protein YbaN (DUF454 family)